MVKHADLGVAIKHHAHTQQQAVTHIAHDLTFSKARINIFQPKDQIRHKDNRNDVCEIEENTIPSCRDEQSSLSSLAIDGGIRHEHTYYHSNNQSQ